MNNNWSTAVHEAQVQQHDKKVADFKRERKQYLDAIAERDAQLEALLGISSSTPTPTKVKADKSFDAEATFVAVASDWHVEETVDPRSVNGLNKFNLEIADQRINKFWKNVVRLAEIQRNGAKIDRLVLILGGDLMSGYIHDELKETNELSPTETVLWLIDRITGGVEFLSKHFGEIVIPCVYGNHGRNTLKPRHATGAANSYEWMMYHILAKHLSHKATFHISDGYHLLVDLYGKTLRVHHGDGLKYQGGTGGLTIPVEKAIASWNKGIPADLDIFGHWHQSQQAPKWICNSSLIGYNAYAVAIKAPYEPPSQTAFLFDKKHGRTGTFPVFCE
jgi:hypothetical protein